MTDEKVKQFFRAAGADGSLGAELRSAADAAVMQAVLQVAQKHGFALTLDELRAYGGDDAELSEQDLGAVAGGVAPQTADLRPVLQIAIFTGGLRKLGGLKSAQGGV